MARPAGWSAELLLLLVAMGGLVASPSSRAQYTRQQQNKNTQADSGFSRAYADSSGRSANKDVPHDSVYDKDEEFFETLLSEPKLLVALIDSGKQFVGDDRRTASASLSEKVVTPTVSEGKESEVDGVENLFQEEIGDVLGDVMHKMQSTSVMSWIVKAVGTRNGSSDIVGAMPGSRFKRSEEKEDDGEDLPVRSLNDIVDLFVIIARQSLEDRGMDQMAIPPLERHFSRSVGVATLRGVFRAHSGWVQRLTTLRRAGDVQLSKTASGLYVSVSAALGLGELTVGFDRYEVDAKALPTVSGRLRADIEDNAVRINVTFAKKEDGSNGCDVTLQDLKLERLDGIKLKMTGLGPLNWLLSRIATWMAKHSREKVARLVEKELVTIVSKELSGIPCDADFITAISVL